MSKCNLNKQLITLFNMAFSITSAVFVGIIFRFIGLPYWLVCGIIATIAVIVEHLLTVYPFGILSKIFIGECEGKEKCKE